MDKDDRFVKIKNIRGRYYYVEIWNYNGVTIVTERASDVQKVKDLDLDESRLIYEMIFHPTGTLNKGWLYNRNCLMDYKNRGNTDEIN